MRTLSEPVTLRQFQRHVDRRFDRLEKTKAGKSELRRLSARSDKRFAKFDKRFDQVDKQVAALRAQMHAHFSDARRHFDMVAESLRDDLRLFADGIHGNTERLDNHEARLRRLERTS
jgi:hypothetical protein